MDVAISCSWQVFAVLWDCYRNFYCCLTDPRIRQERQGMGEKKVKEMWKWAKRLRFIKIKGAANPCRL